MRLLISPKKLSNKFRHVTTLILSLSMTANYIFALPFILNAHAEEEIGGEINVEEPINTATATTASNVRLTVGYPEDCNPHNPHENCDEIDLPFFISGTAESDSYVAKVTAKFYEQNTNNYVTTFTVINSGAEGPLWNWSYQISQLPSAPQDMFKIEFQAEDTSGQPSNTVTRTSVIIYGNEPVDPPVSLEDPVQTGYNVRDFPGDPEDTPRFPNEFACTGGYTNIDGVSVHWTDVSGGDSNIKYQRQYSRDGTTWPGTDPIFTNPYTDYRTFGYGEVEHFSRVRAFYDTNGNGLFDEEEPVSDWSNTCSITYTTILPDTPPAKPTWGTIYKGHGTDPLNEVGCGGYTNTPQITLEWNANSEDDIAGYWFGTKFNTKHQWFDHPNVVKTANMTPGNNPYWYTIIAVDNAGNESEISDQCGLILDQDPPVVEITSHDDGDPVSGIVGITGTVFDTNLWRYWFVIENESGTRVGGLGTVNNDGPTVNLSYTWDTTGLPDGNYIIKLEARDKADNKDPQCGGTGQPKCTGDDGVSIDWVEVYVTNTVLPPQWLAPISPAFITHNADGVYGGGPDAIAEMSFTASESQFVVLYQYQFVRRALDGTLIQTGLVNLPVTGGAYGFNCDNSQDPVVCTWYPNMQENNQWIFRLRAVDLFGNTSAWTNWNNLTNSEFNSTAFTYDDYMSGTGVFSGGMGFVDTAGGYAVRELIAPTSYITNTSPLTTYQPSIDIDFVAEDNETELKLVELWGWKVPVDTALNATSPSSMTQSMLWSGTFEDVELWDGYGTYCFFTIAEDIADDGSMDFGEGNREALPDPMCELQVHYSQYGFVQGRKVNDLNGNGRLEDGEPFMNGWTIYLFDTTSWEDPIQTLITDGYLKNGNEKGLYRFTNLEHGRYYVCEEAREGWDETRPFNSRNRNWTPYDGTRDDIAPYCFVVDLNPGEQVFGKRFGNVENTPPWVSPLLTDATFYEGDKFPELGSIIGHDDTSLDKMCFEITGPSVPSILKHCESVGASIGPATEYTWDLTKIVKNILQKRGQPTLWVDTTPDGYLWEGNYKFTYWVIDTTGSESDQYIVTYTIENVAPKVELTGSLTVNEGQIATFEGQFNDPSLIFYEIKGAPVLRNNSVQALELPVVSPNQPDDEMWSATIYYGDGTSSDLGEFGKKSSKLVLIDPLDPSAGWTIILDEIPGHNYGYVSSDTTFTAVLEVCEAATKEPYDPRYSEGECSKAEVTVTVLNVVPSVTVSPAVSEINTAENVVLTATGTSGNDPLSYSWACANGQSGTGTTIAFSNATIGTFTCSVTVTDYDGDTASAQAVITVGAVQSAVTEPPTDTETRSPSRRTSSEEELGIGSDTDGLPEDEEGEVEAEFDVTAEGEIAGEQDEKDEASDSRICFWWWLLGIGALVINTAFVLISRDKLQDEKWRFAVPVVVAIVAFLMDKLMHNWWTPSDFCKWMWAIALFTVIVPTAVWFIIKPKKS